MTTGPQVSFFIIFLLPHVSPGRGLLNCHTSSTLPTMQPIPPQGEPGYDWLGKVCPVIEMTRESFLSSYNPHRENSIDEAMIKFKGRSTLKQYMPKSPSSVASKYGRELIAIMATSPMWIFTLTGTPQRQTLVQQW